MKKEVYMTPESEEIRIRFENNILSGGNEGGNEGYGDPEHD